MAGTWPRARRAVKELLDGLQIGAILDVAYDGESGGPFEIGETLTFSGGGTARVDDLDDDGTTGTLLVTMLTGSAPVDDQTITGGSSGATAAVNGTPSGLAGQTLSVYLHPPNARQTNYPYGYLRGASRAIERGPTSMRVTDAEQVVRILIAPSGQAYDERLDKYLDAWVLACADLFDSNVALGGAADVVHTQSNTELLDFERESAFGFELTLGIRVSEARTFAA